MKHLAILLTLLSSLYSFASNTTNFPADTTQVSNENVLYKVSQDETYVYLNISTTDKETAMAIIRNGLTIYYDINGKKKKDVYVKYPYSNEPSQSRQGSRENNDTETVDIISMIENLPAEAEYSSFEERQVFSKGLNTLDIAIESNYTAENEVFEFSIKIPKTKISSKENSDFSKLSIGVVAGYFGVMVPRVSVKPCHFERYCNYIKFYCYSFFKAPFLKDSPLRSILCEEFTILSRIASAMVPSPMISYQAETGIWDNMMVEDLL